MRSIHAIVPSLVIACAAFAGDGVFVVDEFDDGDFSVTVNMEAASMDIAASVPGGVRAYHLLGEISPVTLSANEVASELRLDALHGAAFTQIGYGVTVELSGTGFNVTSSTALSLDVSEYEILRFFITRNSHPNLSLDFGITMHSGFSTPEVEAETGIFETPDGFTGFFDIELSQFPDIDFSDLDALSIRIASQPGHRWALGSVELIDLDAPSDCFGDCDGSGAVDFNDLVSMLFEFGATDAPLACNANGVGGVDFNDLVTALFLFGPCP